MVTPITHWQLPAIGTTIPGDSLPLLCPSHAPDTKLVYRQAYRQTKHPHPYNEIMFFLNHLINLQVGIFHFIKIFVCMHVPVWKGYVCTCMDTCVAVKFQWKVSVLRNYPFCLMRHSLSLGPGTHQLD